MTEVISTAMAKLTTAGPTVGISGELSLFDQKKYMQPHEVVLTIQKEHSPVGRRPPHLPAQSAHSSAFMV